MNEMKTGEKERKRHEGLEQAITGKQGNSGQPLLDSW
jgi:hypothetical protein